MRILIITETFLPSTDGVVTRLLEAVKHLHSQGHEVAVIAPDLGVHHCCGGAVPIYGIPAYTMPLYKARKWGVPSPKVGRIMKEFDPDLVHVAMPVLIGLAGIYNAKKQKRALVASYHTHLGKYLSYYGLDYPIAHKALWGVERFIHNQASLNLCTSESVRKELEEHGFHNVKVLRRGVDTEGRHPRFRDAAMYKRLSGGENDKKILIFVGRLAPEKEIDRLLPLMQKRSDIRLAIVGDGPDRERLEELFADTATLFTGFLHGEELSKAYASADAFIFPSVSETLGLVILEAMASGLPVLAARSGPTLEQIRDGENGLLFDVDGPQSLEAAVDQLEDSVLMDAIRAQVRKEAEAYAWPNTSAELFRHYEKAYRAHQRKKNRYPF